MMTRQEAEAIYDTVKETVVSVLLKMDARINELEARIIKLENQIVRNSHNSSLPTDSRSRLRKVFVKRVSENAVVNLGIKVIPLIRRRSPTR